MYGGWNLVLSLIFAALCGQSIGFWPFDVLAAKDGPDNVYENSNAKRIAIIGMLAYSGVPLTYSIRIEDFTFEPSKNPKACL
jgi:hypothetical protein